MNNGEPELETDHHPNENGEVLSVREPCKNSSELIGNIATKYATVRCAIVGGPFLKKLKARDLSRFWKALFRLSKLKYLNCLALTDRSFYFLVEALRLHPPPPQLKSIRLIDLTVTQEDITDNTNEQDQDQDDNPLISFLTSLSEIPTLEAVHLNMSPAEGTVTNTSVCAIFRSTNLTLEHTSWTLDLVNEHACLILEVFKLHYAQFHSLEVSGVDLMGTAVEAITEILWHPSGSLDKLHLSLQMLSEHALPIAEALEENVTLRELSILISGTPEMFRVGPIAESLCTNHGLEWLQISSHLIDDNSAVAFAEALKVNTTLKVLDFSLDRRHDGGGGAAAAGGGGGSFLWITERGYQALLDMLQVNHVLEMMSTHGLENVDIRLKIEYYLKLNDVGIRGIRLYENTSKNQFLETLAEQSEDDDMDCSFYLLATNPNVFNDL